MDLLDRILAAALAGETDDWEFKSAKGGLPRSFWETYSAMANSQGGVVVLGAVEHEGRIRLEGLTDAELSRCRKALWDGLNNRRLVSINLVQPGHIRVIDIDGKSLLVVTIPRASRTQRPVYLRGNPLGNTYQRRHEGDYRLGDVEVRRMLADADELPVDQRILPGFGLSDLDAATLLQYRQRLRLVKGDHPWLALPDQDLLERLGGWRRDRVTGQEGLTLAGLLMFGKDAALRDAAAVPNYFVDYREKLDPALRWTDRLCPDGTWEANLFQFYTRVWPKLSAGLPQPFRLEGEMRRDETPAHEALREAFVNALIHADYVGVGGVVVERYPDRFVIENPGTLLVSLRQYHQGGVSECRNKSLQQMFLLIGGGERAGSGADKIRSGWRTQHWRAPRLDLFTEPDRVRLTLPMVSLIPVETLEWLRRWLGTRMETLTSSELQALATAALEGAVSNARLQELLNAHAADITRTLARLCAEGLLVSDNRRRWTTYRLPVHGSQDASADGHEAVRTGSAHWDPDFAHVGPDFAHLPADSVRSPLGSARLRPDFAHSPEEWSAMQALAANVAQTRKAAPEQVRQAIIALCTGRFLTAEALGVLLGRHPGGLRSRYLKPMVEQRLLRLRYPTSVHRPDQAYTATETTA